MDSKYILGIAEIDSQHEELEAALTTLREAVANKDQWADVPAIVASVYEKLKFHFHFEESIMKLSSYPEALEHQRVHQGILETFESYRYQGFPESGVENPGEQAMRLFHEQILAHDVRFARFVNEHKDRLGIQ